MSAMEKPMKTVIRKDPDPIRVLGDCGVANSFGAHILEKKH